MGNNRPGRNFRFFCLVTEFLHNTVVNKYEQVDGFPEMAFHHFNITAKSGKSYSLAASATVTQDVR